MWGKGRDFAYYDKGNNKMCSFGWRHFLSKMLFKVNYNLTLIIYLAMEKTFNSIDFLKDLADELVDNFKKAGKATTPSLVGSAREQTVRKKLELIFQKSVGVATGCVIDSFGHTSKQTDIIIYEKDFCPVFSINDNPESTYYPCESVIAVGEIKSTLDAKELIKAFANIKSVKESKRHYRSHLNRRPYCSRLVLKGANSESYNQYSKSGHQIYGFILCGKIGMSMGKFLSKCAELIKQEEAYLLPNIIVSLQDGVFVYLDTVNQCTCVDKIGANHFYNVVNPGGEFQYLLSELNQHITMGATTDTLPFDRYIIQNTEIPSNGQMVSIL